MSDPAELLETLSSSAQARGCRIKRYGEIDGYPLLAFQRYDEPEAPHLYLSAGIHGDEPAGPSALVPLLESPEILQGLNLTICPILNPTGLAAGSRENANGVDLNREFRNPKAAEIKALAAFIQDLPSIDFSIALHEDWEAKGFYLYYLNEEADYPIARRIIEKVGQIGPIETATIIDEREAQGGIIKPPQPFKPEEREQWPEAFFLYSQNKHDHLTLETPSSLKLEERVPLLVAAVSEAVLCIRDPAAKRKDRQP